MGDIGPLAGMPVMEGKAMLMETLVGLSGLPVLLNSKDVDTIVETVATIAPTFGAVQLEDISAPRCFEIEERLQERLDIPVMHDDQHSTAVVTTAALTNACRQTGIDLDKALIGQIGWGAAGNALARMLMKMSGNPVLGKGQIILALSNPNPEIDPDAALAAGASFAADEKSVNNVLAFPGILRGAVDTNSPRISYGMYLAAALTIANFTPEGELVPNPLDKNVHKAVAVAVAKKAMDQGLARAEFIPYIVD